MKIAWTIAGAALQLLVLGYMAGEREWVVRTGELVRLRTAPLDPRDVMRGDYVRLDYEISRVPLSACRDGLVTVVTNSVRPPRDTRVYAALKLGDGGLAELDYLSDRRPTTGVFLRGRLAESWGRELQVRYGLEALFMEQGTALQLEKRRSRDGVQVPLEMEVAVSPSGLGVLRNHSWSPMGIGIDFQTRPVSPTNRFAGNRIVGAKVRLLNTSEKELALIDLPEGRSFALAVLSPHDHGAPEWVHAQDPVPAPIANQIVILAPGQAREFVIPLTNAWWFVTQPDARGRPGGVPIAITALSDPWSTRFRLVYRPPSAEACQSLPNAQLIWHGRLPSRAFTVAGGMD